MSESKKMSKMSRKLAEALIASGVEHYDEGGTVTTAKDAAPWIAPVSGVQETGNRSTPTTQGNKQVDFTKFAQHYITADPINLMNDYSTMIKNVGMGFAPQSQFAAVAPGMQNQNFSPAISAMQARQAEVYGQQQNLAKALLAQSQGQGPNPAQNMLNQSTGQNVQGQSAMMAGQRGASVNPALIARQAAMTGAGMQQQATGQAATMQAQQQLAAQQALQQQQQAMASGALQGESIQQGGIAAQNQLSLGAQQINANTAMQNAANAGKGIGGMIQGVGSVAALMANKGGVVPDDLIGIQKYGGEGSKIEAKNPESSGDATSADPAEAIKGISSMFGDGGTVPGRPQVKGDSEKNDTVPALLSPGEVVLPRTVVQGADAPEKAAEFIRHLMAKGDLRPSGGYGDVISARQKKMSRGGRAC